MLRILVLFLLGFGFTMQAYASCSDNGLIRMGATYAVVCNNGTEENVGCGDRGSCAAGDTGLFRISGSKVQYCNSSNWTDFSNSECATAPGTSTSCSLPWGGTIANGASVTAYAFDTGYNDCGATLSINCASFTETRTCTNGVLSGSYTYQSCIDDTVLCCGDFPC